MPAINGAEARAIVDDAIRRYFRGRRSRVPAFVDETFSFRGALSLNAHALGHDLWRAPLNVLMAAPQLGLDAAAAALKRSGRPREARALKARELFFRTAVADAIERKIMVDLLELPYSGPGAPSFKDALAVEILADKRLKGVLGMLEGSWGEGERCRLDALLTENLSIYLNARAAAGEMTGGAITLAAGGLWLHQLTPGMLTLAPAVARAVSVRIAGTAWSIAAAGGVLAAGAMLSAFSGLATDPIQRHFGLHQSRIIKLLDSLEAGFLGSDARFAVNDRYAARLLDVLDALAAALAHIKGLS
ncbi:MAG: hypothetical protein KGJ75_09265 [Alphaproteobacteria bacterium]|nr:hypothetical protein [Alphaproteobacteria bacterium]